MGKYFGSYQTNNLEEEKRLFLKTLYHDKKNGQAIRLLKDRDNVRQFSTFDLEELAQTGTDMQTHCYTTVNAFKNNKRSADQVFNYCSIFIDLDCHVENSDQIEDAKKITAKLLDEAYSDGELAVPTLIVDTGRGYGLQYILARSIANIPSTKGQRAFFKKVQHCLLKRYKNILSGTKGTLDVDFAVADDARVCRIPGTYNANANAYCHLVYASNNYYELSEIVIKCRLWAWKDDDTFKKQKMAKETEPERKVISFAEHRLPFLRTRIDQLRMLQDMRKEECTDNCREQILFIAYSALTQLNKSTAAQELESLNNRFVAPLDQAELDHIVRETDANKCDDYEGFYKLPNQYIIDNLALTEREIQALGFKNGFKRTIERENARKEKSEKRKRVIELLGQVDSLTYDQIAADAGVCRRTVCKIAKEEGLTRYCKEDILPVGESAKIAAESVCVSFTAPDTSAVLATSEAVAVSRVATDVDEYDWYSYLTAHHSTATREILLFFKWSTAFTPSLGIEVEEYLEQNIRKIEDNTLTVDVVLFHLAKMFGKQGREECYAVLQGDITDLPTLMVLFEQRDQEKADRKIKKYEKETVFERKKRIDRYLTYYKDDRFDLIEETDEYSDLDPEVLRLIKITFMQVQRLKRDTIWVENTEVSVAEIKKCFSDMTYKDIVVVCRRVSKQGTLKKLKNPFFYAVQSIYKYKNVDIAKKQADRIADDKGNHNTFCNFEQRKYDYNALEKMLLGL